ncbi:unnamed protein product [Lactuca virosa]|uniref:Uncharacterized protein n=1 Tax=Lactuca virosa TaxID=75947 RepID=A0AAU9NSX8_9ASTR|nr:unnamed protein product [Lactuca virosa]
MDEMKTLDFEFLAPDDSFLGIAFPSLEVLEFEDMPVWERLSTDGGQDNGNGRWFPRLREISITNCGRLEEVSIRLIPSLRVLKIEECSEEVLRRMVSVSSSLVAFVALSLSNVEGLTQLHREILMQLRSDKFPTKSKPLLSVNLAALYIWMKKKSTALPKPWPTNPQTISSHRRFVPPHYRCCDKPPSQPLHAGVSPHCCCDTPPAHLLHADAEAYSRALLEKYGDDLVDHPIDDAELWAKTQREISGASRSSYIYGVGSSDINSLFNGKSSVGAGCSSSSCGSQQEVKELRTQLENVERERVLMQQKQEIMEQQLAQLMRRFGNPPEDRLANYMRNTTDSSSFLLPPSLVSLELEGFMDVESLSEVLQQLPCLKHLDTSSCSKLKDLPETTSTL